MFELGQPLHAFDLDKLAEQRIVVRRARPGEKMRTLDGVERTLAKEMCVIADAARAVAIAGVMGGADSEIGFSSRNILHRIRVVRSHLDSPHVEGARPAHGSLVPLRARRRSGNGRAGLAPRGGTDPASWRRRDSGRRGGRVSAPRAAAENRAYAQGVAARDGRGRSRSRYRGNLWARWDFIRFARTRIAAALARRLPRGNADSLRGGVM